MLIFRNFILFFLSLSLVGLADEPAHTVAPITERSQKIERFLKGDPRSEEKELVTLFSNLVKYSELDPNPEARAK